MEEHLSHGFQTIQITAVDVGRLFEPVQQFILSCLLHETPPHATIFVDPRLPTSHAFVLIGCMFIELRAEAVVSMSVGAAP